MNLLTFEDVAVFTPLFGDGEEKRHKVNIAITNAQRKLRGIICDQLYDALEANAGEPRLDALHDRCLPLLAWWAFAEYSGWAQATDTDAGHRVFADQNSESANPKAVFAIIEQANQTASTYQAEVLWFLEKNLDDYPEFKESECHKCKKAAQSGSITGAGKKKRQIYRVV